MLRTYIFYPILSGLLRASVPIRRQRRQEGNVGIGLLQRATPQTDLRRSSIFKQSQQTRLAKAIIASHILVST